MLRRKMLAVAVATTLMAPAVFADSKNVEMYGVIAYGFMQDTPQDLLDDGNGAQWTVLNESRIGFRGSKEFKNFSPKFIWQIESGFLGANGLTGAEYEAGTLGTRDTFAGFEGGFGKVRFGRLLTPFGEVLDWPYTNAGVGPIIEAAKVINRWDDATYVRHSNMFRWDSPAGEVVSGSVSYGRGGPNGAPVSDSSFVSGLLNVKVSKATLHFGYESHKRDSVGAFDMDPLDPEPNVDPHVDLNAFETDSTGTLIGFETPIVGGLSAYGVWVKGTRDVSTEDDVAVGDFSQADGTYERTSWQAALVYGAGDWIFKLTHAEAGELEGPSATVDESDASMTAVQALYFLDPSAVFYARYVSASDYNNANTVVSGFKSRLLIGMEYYF